MLLILFLLSLTEFMGKKIKYLISCFPNSFINFLNLYYSQEDELTYKLSILYFIISVLIKGAQSFCFRYTFSIKYDITCPFGPFTTFKHYGIIGCFQYQNIYKTKSEFVQKVSNIFHVCMVGALLQLREALTLTLNRYSLFLRTYSLGTYVMIKQRAKNFHA